VPIRRRRAGTSSSKPHIQAARSFDEPQPQPPSPTEGAAAPSVVSLPVEVDVVDVSVVLVVDSCDAPLLEVSGSAPELVEGSGAAGGSSSMPTTTTGDSPMLPAQSVAATCSTHTPGGSVIVHFHGGARR